MSVKRSPADRIVVTNFRYNPGSSISIFNLGEVNASVSGMANGDVLAWDSSQQKFVPQSNVFNFGGTYDSTGSVGGDTLQIRYSTLQEVPLAASLKTGELAYSFLPDNFANSAWDGGSTLYIGDVNGDPVAIGSKRIYDYANHEDGIVSGNNIVITDANGAIDKITIGKMDFYDDTIFVNNPGSDLNLSPGGLGNVNATGHRVVNVADPVNPQDALTLNYLNTNYSQNLNVTVDGVTDSISLKTQQFNFASSNTVLVHYDAANNTISFSANVVQHQPPVIISTIPPTNVVAGDLWYDADSTGRTYVWDSAQWVDIAPPIRQDDLGLVFIDTKPSSPINGQLWFDTTTKESFVWDGAKWSLFSSQTDESDLVIIANTAPANAQVGSLWYDTLANNRTYVWDGTTWLDVAPDTAASANALIIIADVAPANAAIGTAWYDADDTGRTYVWDGIQWVDIAPAPSPQSNANTTILVSATPPSNPWIGMPYYDPATTTGYIWTGTSWLPFSDPDSGAPHSTLSVIPPATPLLGDLWINTGANNHPYAWDGTQWVDLIPTQVQPTIIVTNDPPASPIVGTAWYDADDTGRTYVWDGIQWVDIAPVNPTMETPNTSISISSIPPSNPWVGMPYYDPVTTTGYLWDGARWIEFANPDSGEPHSSISNTAPTIPAIGDLWVDSSSNNAPFVWDGVQWININPPYAKEPTIIVANSAPVTPLVGDAWYDADDTGRTYVWDGSQWVDIAPDAMQDSLQTYSLLTNADLTGATSYNVTIPTAAKSVIIEIENFASTDITGLKGGWFVDGLTASNRNIFIGSNVCDVNDYPFSSTFTFMNYTAGNGVMPSVYLANKYNEKINTISIKTQNTVDGITSGILSVWVQL